MRILITFFIFLSLTACQLIDTALTPMGVIKIQESRFDDTKRVRMSAAITDHGMSANAEFGLRWNSTAGDYAVLQVILSAVTSFDSEKPLILKIDGKDIELLPASGYSRMNVESDSVVGSYIISSHDYVIHKDQIQQIVQGSEGFYRIHLPRNEVFEGEINYDYRGYQSYVVGAFEKFHKEVWGG